MAHPERDAGEKSFHAAGRRRARKGGRATRRTSFTGRQGRDNRLESAGTTPSLIRNDRRSECRLSRRMTEQKERQLQEPSVEQKQMVRSAVCKRHFFPAMRARAITCSRARTGNGKNVGQRGRGDSRNTRGGIPRRGYQATTLRLPQDRGVIIGGNVYRKITLRLAVTIGERSSSGVAIAATFRYRDPREESSPSSLESPFLAFLATMILNDCRSSPSVYRARTREDVTLFVCYRQTDR